MEKFEKQFKLTSLWKTMNETFFDTDFNIVKYKTLCCACGWIRLLNALW